MTINFKNRLIYGVGILAIVLIAALVTGCSKAATPTTTSTTARAVTSNSTGSSGTTIERPVATAAPDPSTPAVTTPPATTPSASSPTTTTPPAISTEIPGITPATPAATIGDTPIILILTPADVSNVPAGDVTISTIVSNFNLVDKSGQANVAGEGHIVYYMDVYPPIIPGQSALTADGTYAESTSTTYTWHDVAAGNHTFSAELVNNNNTALTPVVTVTVYVTAQGSAQSTPASSPTLTSIP